MFSQSTTPNDRLAANKQLAAIFGRMADMYRYLGTGQRFRADAYQQASRTLSLMDYPVQDYGNNIRQLTELKGVGAHIAAKIVEFLQTGRIRKMDELKKKVPYKLLELLDVSGIGPATLRQLHNELHITDRDSLQRSLEKGELETLKGFGKRKIENIRKLLKLKADSDRLPLATAVELATKYAEALRRLPAVQKVEIAGSIRRKAGTVGDIDLIAVAAAGKGRQVINQFVKLPGVTRVLARGRTRASVMIRSKQRQVDLRVVQPHEWGSALFYFTGNKEHNIRIRTLARQRGWKFNEYGLFDHKTGQRLAGETEEEIYRMLGYHYIPPEERQGGRELERYRMSKPK